MLTLVLNSQGDVRRQAEAVKDPAVRAAAFVEVKEAKTERTQADSQELARLQTALAQHDMSLKFSKDETTNNIVVQMIDGRTGDSPSLAVGVAGGPPAGVSVAWPGAAATAVSSARAGGSSRVNR